MTCNKRCTNIFTCIYIYRVAHYKVRYSTCRRIFFVEILTYCSITKFAQSHSAVILECCRLNSLWINNSHNSSRSSILYTIDYKHSLRYLLHMRWCARSWGIVIRRSLKPVYGFATSYTRNTRILYKIGRAVAIEEVEAYFANGVFVCFSIHIISICTCRCCTHIHDVHSQILRIACCTRVAAFVTCIVRTTCTHHQCSACQWE